MRIRMGKDEIKKALLFLMLTVFNVFGALVAFNSRNLANIIDIKLFPLLILSFAIWILFPIKTNLVNNKLKGTYILLCIIEFLSACFRFESAIIFSAMIALLISFFLLRSLAYYDFDTIYPIFAWSSVTAAVVLILIFGVASFNSQGVVYAFVGIMALNLLCIKKRDKIIYYAFVVICTVIILSLTKSRASMMGFLVAAVISYYYLFFKKKSIKNFLVGLAIAVAMVFLYSYLESFFYSIFFKKWGNTDITSNRLSIWNYIWANKNMIGNGIDHLNGGDAHNTVMQVLGVEGIISAIAFICLLLGVIKSIGKVNNKIVFVNFFVSWLLISCFENLDIFTSRILSVSILFLAHLFLLMIAKETVGLPNEGHTDE